MSDKQTMGFQTEVKEILNLVVHSLYSNKEIFLRELISNASDALDKLRFIALSNANLYENDSDLKIIIETDSKKKTITIKDNGIGMNKEDAIAHLGTIAKSGTKEFLEKIAAGQASESNLIGQFGVGFYSAFIVADKVTVKSRKAGEPENAGIIWESKGDGEFSIAHKSKATRGTEIILHLKEEEIDFANDWRIKSLITKYSEHICWPIEMKGEKELEKINKATALWTQNKNEISDEDYKAFYKHISHDYEDPMIWSHNHVEGKQEYISLLYIPAHAPFDLWQPESKNGLKLYVKRVFILDDAAQFLPRYLRFVKGIIDAKDLPLNVSREILQDNKIVENIKSACTKRILSMLEKLSNEDAEKYQKFWQEFSLVFKEGPIEDFTNKDTITKLLRFASTHNDSEIQNVSLQDYVNRMAESQEKIYFITASSYNAAKNSPQLEIFKKKNIEVLLLSDKIDEWMTGYIGEFSGKSLQNIGKGKIELPGEEDKKEDEEVKKNTENLEPMLKQMQEILGDKVKDVRFTSRLTDSPTCIIVDEQDMGLEMQRILAAAGQKVPAIKPILEINPDHKLIKKLHDVHDDNLFKEWTELLFEQALLADGGQLDNPAQFVKRVNHLLLI